MKRLILLLTFLICLVHIKGQDKRYAVEVIRSLTSPEFKGRGYVGDGHKIASGYIAREYSEAGLQSFFNGKNEERFFQEFPIKVNTFPKSMMLKVDNVELFAGQEFLVHPSSSSFKGKYEICRIDKARITEPDALSMVQSKCEGKVLMIDTRGSTDEADQRQTREAVEFYAFSPGIPTKGTILVTDEKLTWSISKKREKKTLLTINSKKLATTPGKVAIDVSSSFKTHQTRNIIGYLPGTQTPDSFIFIIAHYDHLGMMGSNVYFPGANDNASGVAMLLSLAKHFSLNPHRYTIVFVAMAAEESGLDGAKYFVEHSPVDLKKAAFLINFDLAGTGEEGIKVVNGSLYTREFERLKSLNSEGGYMKDVQARGPACNSDHCVFHDKGVRCFYIYTLGGSTAYHDVHDNLEALSFSEFTDYVKLMIEFLQKY